MCIFLMIDSQTWCVQPQRPTPSLLIRVLTLGWGPRHPLHTHNLVLLEMFYCRYFHLLPLFCMTELNGVWGRERKLNTMHNDMQPVCSEAQHASSVLTPGYCWAPSSAQRATILSVKNNSVTFEFPGP